MFSCLLFLYSAPTSDEDDDDGGTDGGGVGEKKNFFDSHFAHRIHRIEPAGGGERSNGRKFSQDDPQDVEWKKCNL